jgi:hypothetical protein
VGSEWTRPEVDDFREGVLDLSAQLGESFGADPFGSLAEPELAVLIGGAYHLRIMKPADFPRMSEIAPGRGFPSGLILPGVVSPGDPARGEPHNPISLQGNTEIYHLTSEVAPGNVAVFRRDGTLLNVDINQQWELQEWCEEVLKVSVPGFPWTEEMTEMAEEPRKWKAIADERESIRRRIAEHVSSFIGGMNQVKVEFGMSAQQMQNLVAAYGGSLELARDLGAHESYAWHSKAWSQGEEIPDESENKSKED